MSVQASEKQSSSAGEPTGFLRADTRYSLAQSSSAQKLIADKIASRVQAQDASVYNFSAQAEACAKKFMGWTQLLSHPPLNHEELICHIEDIFLKEEQIERVILIGEGGSSQAPMTVTKINALEGRKIRFSTLDSLSPLYLHKILGSSDLERALIIVSSKSGSTLETISLARILWDCAQESLGSERAASRFIAITDPNTKLEQQARRLGWRAVFLGIPQVGGRFSALSSFGLVPLGLVGMDLRRYLKKACIAEAICSQDSLDNPAIQLASFLYDKISEESAHAFSFMSPQPGRVLGLWIEQMIAESLGKDGISVVPQIAVNPALLNDPYPVRPVITYALPKDDEEFKQVKANIDDDIPALHYSVESSYELGAHFVMWEYATAFLGYLLKVCPFDQPDVQSAKVNTSRALYGLLPTYACELEDELVFELSEGLRGYQGRNLDELLEYFLSQIESSSWCALNCFLPFTGERREPLERMRHSIAQSLGVPCCLEIGPRYLHSTGQLQKGGANTGVFLIISASEDDDILIPGESHTLGDIIIAQAKGDLSTLSERGRKALHIHLPNNHPQTLEQLAQAVEAACKKLARY